MTLVKKLCTWMAQYSTPVGAQNISSKEVVCELGFTLFCICEYIFTALFESSLIIIGTNDDKGLKMWHILQVIESLVSNR